MMAFDSRIFNIWNAKKRSIAAKTREKTLHQVNFKDLYGSIEWITSLNNQSGLHCSTLFLIDLQGTF